MYFSKITLKQNLEKVKLFQLLCPDEYKIHQHLWGLLGTDKNEKRSFLYRHDENSKWPQFYVLSENEPQNKDDLWEIATREFRPQLSEGQQLSFSLIANPVKIRKTDEFRKTEQSKIRLKTNTKHNKIQRDDIVWLAKQKVKNEGRNYKNEILLEKLIQEEGEEWLTEKGCNKGFKLQNVVVDSYRQMQFYKRGTSKSIKISTLRFTGTLLVNDPAIFIQENFEKHNDKNEYIAGIGPAKAFGCGLLLIKPIRNG
jgi:CRISPR system Cascade subunit CasE